MVCTATAPLYNSASRGHALPHMSHVNLGYCEIDSSDHISYHDSCHNMLPDLSGHSPEILALLKGFFTAHERSLAATTPPPVSAVPAPSHPPRRYACKPLVHRSVRPVAPRLLPVVWVLAWLGGIIAALLVVPLDPVDLLGLLHRS